MRKSIFFVLILLNSVAFSKCDKMETFRQSAKKEGWTFHFSEHHRRHSKGLKKKFILSSERKSFLNAKVQIPNSLDLRPNISPIQDQGECGSCWAHSLTATLQDGYPERVESLSSQYLVDCAANADGCQGGYFDAALYLVFPKGTPTDKAYPYTAQDGTCQNLPTAASIASYHLLGSSSGPSTRDIEAYMARHRKPVSVTVSAGSGAWQNYDSGIYNGCVQGNVDHMINIVGWDNEGATFDHRGNLPPGKGVWILRNSWGTSWGEQGWMRTKMTDLKGKKCNDIADEAAYFDFRTNAQGDEDVDTTVTSRGLLYAGIAILGIAGLLSLLLF